MEWFVCLQGRVSLAGVLVLDLEPWLELVGELLVEFGLLAWLRVKVVEFVHRGVDWHMPGRRVVDRTAAGMLVVGSLVVDMQAVDIWAVRTEDIADKLELHIVAGGRGMGHGKVAHIVEPHPLVAGIENLVAAAVDSLGNKEVGVGDNRS